MCAVRPAWLGLVSLCHLIGGKGEAAAHGGLAVTHMLWQTFTVFMPVVASSRVVKTLPSPTTV